MDITKTIRRNRSLLAVATAVVLLPAVLTGCSSGGPGGGPTDTTGTAAAGVTLAECMRDRGYDMPDPGNGGPTVQLSAPDGVDEEQYRDDLTGCLDDTAGAGEADAAKPAPGMAGKALEAAACIREHGFSDYPDDEEGWIAYQPEDEAAFDEVARSCDDRVFGSSGQGSSGQGSGSSGEDADS
ncbi:hypothetical protein [Curtobacterium aurantiacum]|uniref:hypothetical protein n=1 Tax=Curtobacterium aurantiacum TaxID=3236919 RepID=UPI001BDFA436|nr:hypothetical protein [Curtobacterium flaccumfaciens]MBT1675126.1 hypothetical protein [Curtobacterium flaccumfaciens pv. flaccumfaciens]